MEEIKNKIRQICTYHSDLGEGTSGYNLSEEQFQKIFEMFEIQVKINTNMAEDICKMIDDIELSYRDSSLEEWKAFKHIRNAIRDKYMPWLFQKDQA